MRYLKVSTSKRATYLMKQQYSDDELFLGKRSFYFIALGLLMFMDPFFEVLSPLFSSLHWLKPTLMTLYLCVAIYFCAISYEFIFTKNSNGDYIFSASHSPDEYYDSIRALAYQYSFNANIILIFACYLLFKIPQLEGLLSLELICKFFIGTLLLSYGITVLIKIKQDERHD